LVDRKDAPQSVIALVRPGLDAANPSVAPLGRVNTALGGSFTSRLNQDLREEHGWSYGARSRVSSLRTAGMVAAQAAVQTEHTGEALGAMLGDTVAFARDGLTDDEVDKTRSQARAELVETYESVRGASGRLAGNAMQGLPPDYEAKASKVRDLATKAQLAALAKAHFDPSDATIVVVGPEAKVLPQLGVDTLKAAKLGDPIRLDAEGRPVRSAAKSPLEGRR
jgi:predicted Zn-dependent peptidase